MENNKKKIMMLNTLVLILCVAVVSIFAFMPVKEVKVPLNIYTISFDSSGGSKIAAIEIKDGEVVNKPDTPTKDGYIFAGWLLDGKPFDFTTEITGDVTLTASWKEKEPDKVYYTVTFNSNGGSAFASQEVEKGTKAYNPGTPTKEGFDFVGWQLNGNNYNFNSPVNGNITITAAWKEKAPEPTPEPEKPEEPKEKKYTVRFNANGGSATGSQTIKENGHATRPRTPSRKGYKFISWQLNGRDYDFNSKVTKNITLVAKWEKIPLVFFDVKLNYDGGKPGTCPVNGMTKVEKGKKISTITCKPTKPHHAFTGWTNGGSVVNGPTATNATWKINTFKVGCQPQGDELTSISCLLYITENGKRINADAIYVNGTKKASFSKKFFETKDWNFTFDYDGLKKQKATK